MCNHYQEEAQAPLTPQQVIVSHQSHLQTHQEPTIFHAAHDLSCHENPPINLPYEKLKDRGKNNYFVTSQEVDIFEF